MSVARPSDGPTDPSRRSRRADPALERETNKIIKDDRRRRRASRRQRSTVTEIRVGDGGDGVGERRQKFQREADASLKHETEVVLFAEIRGEIERVQSASGGIVFATDVQTFVFAEFTGFGKHAVVGSYIAVSYTHLTLPTIYSV